MCAGCEFGRYRGPQRMARKPRPRTSLSIRHVGEGFPVFAPLGDHLGWMGAHFVDPGRAGKDEQLAIDDPPVPRLPFFFPARRNRGGARARILRRIPVRVRLEQFEMLSRSEAVARIVVDGFVFGFSWNGLAIREVGDWVVTL